MALTFVDTNFPSNLTVGLQSNIFFNTVEVTTPFAISDLFENGVQYGRLQYQFDASQMEIGGAEMAELKEFFIKYRYKSFRLRDPLEYEVESELFATGDSSTVSFQLYTNYDTVQKPITKPVDDANFKIYINAIEQTETTHYSVDYNTGIVTFVSAPGVLPLTWDGIFDIHVRFDIDSLQASVTGLRRGNFTGIGMIEEITV